jgi:hypothetical protein
MVDVLEEVTSETITREHVVKRVDDWVRRLNSLFEHVEGWLPAGWRVSRRGNVQMHEAMMKRFRLKPRSVPILELTSDKGSTAYLEPRALWIVGTNGRVDLYSGDKHHVIIDLSKAFAKPNWQISDFNDRRESGRLDRRKLASALAQ